MKNNLPELLVMACKYTVYGFILQFFAFTVLLASEVNGQGKSLEETRITLQLRGVSVSEALEVIEAKTKYKFAYEEKDLPAQVTIAVDMVDKPLSAVLESIGNQTSLQFRQRNSTIYVKPVRLSPTREPDATTAVAVTVSGKVTDAEENEPLPGVNVVVKGTTTGTVTDAEGRYSLSVPDGNAVLIFSFVGYAIKEVTVDRQTVIDVALDPDVKALSEVVVIGYGTQEKSDITGAVSTVDGEELTRVPVASFDQALAGRAAGVQVVAGSGIPGAGASIRVRGVGTLNNAEPLYVIDGIILGNVSGGGQTDISPLSLINPNDIESINILKDASATAIYGARAGNGVVIITTKKGGSRRPKFTFDSYYGFSEIKNNVDFLSPTEWASYYDNLRAKSNQTTYPGSDFVRSVINGDEYPTYDWLDAATRKGTIQSYDLSLNAGSEVSSYYASLSYFDQQGIFLNSDLDRYTMRFNSDHKVGKRFKFGNALNFSRTTANIVGNFDGNSNSRNWLTRLVESNPFRPIYDAEGNYAGAEDFEDPQLDHSNQHVMWQLREPFQRRWTNKLWASVYGELEIVKGLRFRSAVSIDGTYAKDEDRLPNTIGFTGNAVQDPDNNSLGFASRESRTWFSEQTLTYDKTIAKDHQLTLLAGFQAQNSYYTNMGISDGRYVDTQYWFFDRPKQTTDILDANGNVVTTLPINFPDARNGQIENAVVSYFGRAIYSLQDKYLFTATVRRDGSSRFGRQNRWGTFPAMNVGWRISEESFMKDIRQISALKLRAGYGVSGSDNTGNYQYQSTIGTGGDFNYVFNEGRVEGGNIQRVANEFLQWEEIKMLNVGLDVGLFANRLEVTLDWYKKNTDKLFLTFAPPLEVGAEQNPSGNLGEVRNTGFEAGLRGDILVGEGLRWTANANFSTVKNEVLALAADGADRFVGQNITRIGQEIGAIYGYVADGIFQNWDEVYAHAYQDQATTGLVDENGRPVYDPTKTDMVTTLNFTSPGDVRFRDLNGDGIIEGQNDRTIIGSTIPDLIWGLNNDFSYRGFKLSVFLQGVHGVDIYNGLRASMERNVETWWNRRRSVLNAWDGEGSSTTFPRAIIGDPNTNERVSSRFIDNGSFIRLRNIRLAYDFGPRINTALGLQNFQVYVNATNLLTITDYDGYDPEIGLRNGNNPETAGIDNGTYPLPKQYTFGLRVTF